jgi:hypothetical protein
MRKALVHLLILAALAGALFLAFGSAPAAADNRPCWQKLLGDWYDGRIDGDYSAKCYAAAIKNAPEDLRQYGDLPSDLTRALAVAPRDPSGKIILANNQGHNPRNGQSKKSGPHKARNLSTGSLPKQDPPNKGGPQAITDLGRASDNSIPLPLLALGSLALLLIAAGAATFVAHRIKAHRATVTPPPKAP